MTKTVFLLDSKPHQPCDCDPYKGPCKLGRERVGNSAQLSYCVVPCDPAVLLHGYNEAQISVGKDQRVASGSPERELAPEPTQDRSRADTSALRPTLHMDEIVSFVREQLDNCHRIAATKEGAERIGWLDDARFHSAIITALSTLVATPVGWRWRQRGPSEAERGEWQEWHVVGHKPQGPESRLFQFEPLFPVSPLAAPRSTYRCGTCGVECLAAESADTPPCVVVPPKLNMKLIVLLEDIQSNAASGEPDWEPIEQRINSALCELRIPER